MDVGSLAADSALRKNDGTGRDPTKLAERNGGPGQTDGVSGWNFLSDFAGEQL